MQLESLDFLLMSLQNSHNGDDKLPTLIVLLPPGLEDVLL